jgi:hypothetical protein
MKKIYLALALLVLGINSKAQLTLTNAANAPVVGDMVSYAEYDSTTAVPKSTGAAQNWNFTSCSLGSFTESITYTTVASTPFAALYPSANLAGARGTNNWDYYNSQSSTLYYAGFAKASNTTAVTFTNLGAWMPWPTSMGTTTADVFSGSEIAPTYTNAWTGSVSINGAGTGTVTLPNGNKHTNCLQVIKSLTVNVTATQPSTFTQVTYEYYSSSSKFPIISVQYNSQKTGTVVQNDYHIDVNTSALSVGLNESELNNSDLIVYPNPTKNQINVQLPGNAIALKIELFDAQGKLVLTSSHTNTLNTSSLPKGIYSVKVTSNNSRLQKQIVITD